MSTVTSPCPDCELLLHGLADGELDAANALALEEHLKTCEGCAATYNGITQYKEMLKAEKLRFSAPSSLRDRILAQIATENGAKPEAPQVRKDFALKRRLPLSSTSHALAAFSAMALAASLVLFLSTGSPTPGVDNQLAAAHVRSLLASHLTDVTSSDQHTVKPWFLGKLDFAPPVADLAQKGFPLIGGRLDYIGGRVVSALVYMRHGHVINLFVWPEGALKAVNETLEGYHIVSWTVGGFTYTAVSDMNAAELQDFQAALKEALA
jgi:anti-sigma factor RsiW